MPRIGLLSDSHGRARTTQRAVDALLDAGADMLIHLGDVGSVEVIDALASPKPGETQAVEAHLVFGNTDWDLDDLGKYARSLGVHVDHPVGRILLGDGQGELVFLHGHEENRMRQALSQGVRYLCHGHTHRVSDEHQGKTRVINPGALFRASQYTAAILDTQSDTIQVLNVGI